MKLALCLIWGISATWAVAGAVSYKTYDLLQGKDGSGSAFIIKQDKTYFAVFSIHQFEGRKPGVEDSAGHPLSLMPAPSRRFDDVQVWELTDQSGAYPYLAYREQFTLKNGETLAIRGLEGVVVTGAVTGLGLRIFDSENPCPRSSASFISTNSTAPPSALKNTSSNPAARHCREVRPRKKQRLPAGPDPPQKRPEGSTAPPDGPDNRRACWRPPDRHRVSVTRGALDDLLDFS